MGTNVPGKEPFRVLEFYSGIGGMRYSLNQSGIQALIVEGFDINNVANEVYKYNFRHSPCQRNIQSLTAAELDKFQADVWLLSPPCQPYTRQGLQKDINDARASSFLKLLELIPTTSFPPRYLCMENVVGFESSATHRKMIEALERNNFVTQEFILSPLQFGIPYSRPRYFCLAKRLPLSFKHPEFNGKLVSDIASHILREDASLLHEIALLDSCEESNSGDGKSNFEYNGSCQPIGDFLQADLPGFQSYAVPLDLIERWGDAMDIVFPDSKRCCCFTKSYGRYVKGTGSLLATAKGAINGVAINKENWKQFTNNLPLMKLLKLRYFTPREIANLHSFPEDFSFPSHVSLRQRYALLGNSISIAVVASLLKYLFTEQSYGMKEHLEEAS